MAPRLIDYPLAPPARLAYAVRTVGVGIAAGGSLGFLLALAASITVNEAFIDLWYQLDGDPFSRAFVPLLFVVLLIGLGIYAVADSFYNWQLGRQLATHAESTPEDVPAAWQRVFLTRTNPLAGVRATLWTICVAAGLFSIIIAAILGDTSDNEFSFVLSMLLSSLATTAAAATIAIVASRWAANRWPAIAVPAELVWTDTAVSAAAEAEKARRPRRQEQIDLGSSYRALRALVRHGTRVGLAVLLTGAAIGFLGVAIRQPCRRCDQRSYESAGEALIDNLALVGAGLALLGAVVLIAASLASLASSLLATRALRHLLDPSTPAGVFPPKALLLERLTGMPLSEKTAIIVSGVGSTVAACAIALSAVAARVPGAFTDGLLLGGLGATAVAGVIAFAGVGATLRMRRLIRGRWAPGDVSSPPAKARR